MIIELATWDEIAAMLAVRIRQHRLRAELSQQELADRAAVSVGAVRKLERNGQTTVETLIKVAQVLRLTGEMADLFARAPVNIAELERRAQISSRQRAPRQRRVAS